MKTFIITLLAFASLQSLTYSQTIIELDSSQSMLITGKGPGQDGAINPYSDQDCIAIVENMGESVLDVRIQKEGKIINIISIKTQITQEIKLEKGYELYFDSNAKAKAKIEFKPIE